MKDPYTILGVSKSADDDEIKKAYRELAKKNHPDLNPNDKAAEQRFKEISVAYKLIGTKEARNKFEQGEFDEQFREQAGRSGPFYHEYKDGGTRYNFNFDGDIDSIFESLFGQKKEGQFDVPGQDYLYTMEIELKDAAKGAEHEILLAGNKRLKVKIPPGIDDDARLRFKGQGGAGHGKGKTGDAYVIIRIKPSKIFKRLGKNIETELPITLDEAINGSKLKVQTLIGSVMLNIPPGVNTGARLRIKGQGMPGNKGKPPGDQIVHIKIMLPDKIDPELQNFIKEWAQKNPYNPGRN